MIRIALALTALSLAGTVTSADTDARVAPAPQKNPFLDKIVVISGDPDGSTLYFENARVELVFGRQMFVGEQVIPDEDNPHDASYVVTGAVHFFPWERVGACIAMPPDLVGRRVDPREISTDKGG